MVKVIPAHIENGHIVPDEALPPMEQVTGVSIHVEVMSRASIKQVENGPAESGVTDSLYGILKTQKREPVPPHPEASGFLRWAGILKDYHGDPKADYRKHLEEKYL